jgi:hypothetical protein
VKKILVALALSGLTAMAQNVISAKAGVVHYLEGEAMINDQAVVMKESKFPELKNKDVLRTTDGRVELLLAPGSFLRLADNSAVRMESNSILATRLSVLEGTAIIEVLEVAKLSSLEFAMGNDTVTIRKPGLYRLEMNSPAVKIYSGEVAINANNELIRLSEGKMMTLTGDHLVAKFDKKNNMDEIVQWADLRAGTLAMANIHSARTLGNSMASNQRLGSSGWMYNSFYGMMTYVPFGRGFFSPFGYNFFSPSTVYAVYNPPVYSAPSGGYDAFSAGRSQVGYNGDLGYNTSSMRSSSGYSGVGGGGAPAAAAAPAPVAGGERAGGAAAAGGARGGGGGGGSNQ